MFRYPFSGILNLEIRVSKKDLEKERGVVLEEYIGNRNATGRMQDAHWILLMEGSKVPFQCEHSAFIPLVILELCCYLNWASMILLSELLLSIV